MLTQDATRCGVAQHACSGVPVVRSCVQRILARCFMVLYAQVSAWAVACPAEKSKRRRAVKRTPRFASSANTYNF